MKNYSNRRKAFKQLGLSLAALFGISGARAASSNNNESAAPKLEKKVVGEIVKDQQDMPLFSGAVTYGNLLFIAGKGAHFDGDIKDHTNHVLNIIQEELEKNGSSMEKVLKVNVYLADLADYHKMNEVYRGRFGDSPPVRTTVATYGGVPGDSLVEIDCIAAV